MPEHQRGSSVKVTPHESPTVSAGVRAYLGRERQSRARRYRDTATSPGRSLPSRQACASAAIRRRPPGSGMPPSTHSPQPAATCQQRQRRIGHGPGAQRRRSRLPARAMVLSSPTPRRAMFPPPPFQRPRTLPPSRQPSYPVGLRPERPVSSIGTTVLASPPGAAPLSAGPVPTSADTDKRRPERAVFCQPFRSRTARRSHGRAGQCVYDAPVGAARPPCRLLPADHPRRVWLAAKHALQPSAVLCRSRSPVGPPGRSPPGLSLAPILLAASASPRHRRYHHRVDASWREGCRCQPGTCLAAPTPAAGHEPRPFAVARSPGTGPGGRPSTLEASSAPIILLRVRGWPPLVVGAKPPRTRDRHHQAARSRPDAATEGGPPLPSLVPLYH